jgi:hypothetical protein
VEEEPEVEEEEHLHVVLPDELEQTEEIEGGDKEEES